MPDYIVAKVTVEVEITVRGAEGLDGAVGVALGHLAPVPEHKVISVSVHRTL